MVECSEAFDLSSIRRAAREGGPILPAQVLALCDEVGRARRWASAWKAVAKYERLTSAAGWAGAVAGVETANMMLRGKVERMGAVVMAARAWADAIDRQDVAEIERCEGELIVAIAACS